MQLSKNRSLFTAGDAAPRVSSTLERTPARLHHHTASYRRTLALYYGLLALAALVGLGYGFFFSDLFFPGDKPPLVEQIMSTLKLAWLIPLPYALVNFYGYLRYPAVRRTPPPEPTALPVTLYFRYVTRGQNPTLSAENAHKAFHRLSETLPEGNWLVEIVSDNPLTVDDCGGRVRVICVPRAYQTAQGAKFKARALQYALEHIPAAPEDWIIHLDEETTFDGDTIRAVNHFIAVQREQVEAGMQTHPAIGQGVILYGRGEVGNWVTTLADSIRVADDYGRFRMQFERGKAFFGLHGSFVVINQGVEQMIGFDHGTDSSITEDTFFGLVAQSLGVPFRFIHAYMYERSPFTIADFIRQRRRWFGGLWLCVRTPQIPFAHRLILGLFIGMWSTSWLCVVMTIVNLLYPTGTPLWLSLLAGLSFAFNVAMYIFGYIATLYGQVGRGQFALRLLQQILLIPFFSLMEGAAVLYGLAKPPRDFFIVQKEQGAQTP